MGEYWSPCRTETREKILLKMRGSTLRIRKPYRIFADHAILHHLPARGHNAVEDDLVEFYTREETVGRILRWR